MAKNAVGINRGQRPRLSIPPYPNPGVDPAHPPDGGFSQCSRYGVDPWVIWWHHGGVHPSPMYRISPLEAQDLFLKAATFMTACDEAIDEADALLTSIAETVEFSSFNPEQRASLAQWHSGVKESRIALRK